VKVAVFSPYDLGRHGGVQDQARRITGWLRDSGHESVLVGPGTEGPPGSVLLGGTRVIPANRAATPIGIDPLARRRIAAAVGDCDVFHVHEPFMPIVSPAALGVDGPAKVATFHADPPGWARNVYRLGRPALRSIIRRAGVVTAVSPVAASAIDGLAPYRIIPNGLDVSSYPTGPEVPDRVLFLGRDDERKGLSILLEAWPAVRDAVPDANLVVVGAERDETPPGVDFLGAVSEERKRAELAAAGVFVAPNLGGESFGIVVVEAMAAATAIVASALPAFVHVIADAGVLVAPGDVVGLSDAVVRLLLDAPERKRLADTAARRSRRFDGPTIVEAYLEAYQDALTSGR